MKTNVSINEELKYRGYNPNLNILIPSKELLQIEQLLREKQINPSRQNNIKYRKALELSREFILKNMQLSPIPFFDEKIIGPIKIERSGMIGPLELPIKKAKNVDDFYGCLREVLTLRDGETIDSAYRFIEISKNITSLSSLAYTHEIVHSQLNHVRGLITEYYNIELLSIFFETVQAYETDHSESLLRLHDSIRLSELAEIIKELNQYQDSEDQEIINVLIEGSSYAESTLKAYNLFMRYYYSSTAEKKYILTNINRVFKRELTLEELLSQLDVSLENSQNYNQLKKYYTR